MPNGGNNNRIIRGGDFESSRNNNSNSSFFASLVPKSNISQESKRLGKLFLGISAFLIGTLLLFEIFGAMIQAGSAADVAEAWGNSVGLISRYTILPVATTYLSCSALVMATSYINENYKKNALPTDSVGKKVKNILKALPMGLGEGVLNAMSFGAYHKTFNSSDNTDHIKQKIASKVATNVGRDVRNAADDVRNAVDRVLGRYAVARVDDVDVDENKIKDLINEMSKDSPDVTKTKLYSALSLNIRGNDKDLAMTTLAKDVLTCFKDRLIQLEASSLEGGEIKNKKFGHIKAKCIEGLTESEQKLNEQLNNPAPPLDRTVPPRHYALEQEQRRGQGRGQGW